MVDLGHIPKIEKSSLSDAITLRIDGITKRDLDQLKYQYGIDTAEWLRKVIRREIDHVKQTWEKSS